VKLTLRCHNETCPAMNKISILHAGATHQLSHKNTNSALNHSAEFPA